MFSFFLDYLNYKIYLKCVLDLKNQQEILFNYYDTIE